eukprot:1421506-Rhodomonas_salina.2
MPGSDVPARSPHPSCPRRTLSRLPFPPLPSPSLSPSLALLLCRRPSRTLPPRGRRLSSRTPTRRPPWSCRSIPPPPLPLPASALCWRPGRACVAHRIGARSGGVLSSHRQSAAAQ